MVKYEPPQTGLEGFTMNPARIRYDAYRLLATIYASQRFPHEPIDTEDPRSLAHLASEFEADEITHLLLTIAIAVRTTLNHETERAGLVCGELADASGTKPLALREACNKVIHAEKIRADVELDGSRVVRQNPIMHLEGEAPSGERWTARLELEPFGKHLLGL
jgi:hypothetical protein